MQKVKLFFIASITLVTIILQANSIMASDNASPNRFFVYDAFNCYGGIMAYTLDGGYAYDIAWVLRGKSIGEFYFDKAVRCQNLNWAY